MERNKEKQKTYINKWQKENRKRIVVLATLDEYNSINQQAQENNQSLTRYLIECHNKNIEQSDSIQEQDNNTQQSDNKSINHKSGITFNR